MQKTTGLILFLILIFCSQKVNAQVGARVSYIKPAYISGYLFKPTACFELVYNDSESDNKFRIGVSLGIMKMATNKDTLPSYALYGDLLLPGYEVYSNFLSVPLGFNIAYRPLTTKLSPVIGTDLYVHLNSYNYVVDYPTFKHEEQRGAASIAYGLLPRIGLAYNPNDTIELTTGVGKYGGLESRFGIMSYWKIYFMFKYIID